MSILKAKTYPSESTFVSTFLISIFVALVSAILFIMTFTGGVDFAYDSVLMATSSLVGVAGLVWVTKTI